MAAKNSRHRSHNRPLLSVGTFKPMKSATPLEAAAAEIDRLNARERQIQNRLTTIQTESGKLYTELNAIPVKRAEKLREVDQLARGK